MRGLVLAALVSPIAAHAADDFVRIPSGAFRSALKYDDVTGDTRVAAFALMRNPVTNAGFLAFVRAHPEWRRDVVPSVFAGPGYLSHWGTPLAPGSAAPRQPVTRVSWFAASAFCEAQHARLPTWNEWEYAAAADATRRDARSDPAWRERILGWYARPATAPLDAVGRSPRDAYGVQDMHGLVWEWTGDFASMLATVDERLRFCGATAMALQDRENYAVLMRVAMLSSLEAADSTSSLGFRCARSLPGERAS